MFENADIIPADWDKIVATSQAKVDSQLSPYDYREGLRPEQVQPGGLDWLIWLIMAGRGWGKTHTGARWLIEQAVREPGEYAVIAPTFTDCRKVCVEGPSGLVKAIAPEHFGGYHKTKWQISLSNGSIIHMLSADQPDRIRGYNLSGAWCDELGAWRYPSAWYDGLVPALRIGTLPRVLVTTTPRSTKLMRDLAGRRDGTIILTRGRTWDNAANLSAAALAEFSRWAGTTRGRQELEGELLEDMPGAHWKRAWIDDHRRELADVPELVRVVVGVDPSGNDGDKDETGIVVAGIDRDGHIWVLDDATVAASPDAWAKAVVRAYKTHKADRIVAEKNFGGAMVAATIKHADAAVPVKMVNATRGKVIRAEPIAALYEQGRVHHVGAFPDMEDQMTQWDDSKRDSPDRMDALVWACTELHGGAGGLAFLSAMRTNATAAGVDVDHTSTDWLAAAAALHNARADRQRLRVFAERADQPRVIEGETAPLALPA